MAEKTISYTPSGKGWTSFHSWIPDWMIGLNSSLYTWKGGQLYKHDSNALRNNYYGEDSSIHPSTVTPIVNDNPTENKVFKTICLESNEAWEADINTDLSTGEILQSQFEKKEGEYYAYIRRDANTIDMKSSISTQGIGNANGFAGTTYTFGFPIESSVSVGDEIYRQTGANTITLVGVVQSHTPQSITMASVAGGESSSDFVVLIKNSTAESFGARGTYMAVKLTNSSDSKVELFTVSSEVFKSYP